MGFYNTLDTAVVCPNCNVKFPVHIQFKFGATRQLTYNVGDLITWGYNEVGSRSLTNVKAYGIVESTICPSCNEDKIPEEYDVFIKDNVITGFAPVENAGDYLEGSDGGEYVVI